MNILFILKKRLTSGGDSYSSPSFFNSGLYTSANFINEMLQGIKCKGCNCKEEITSNLVQAVDNNEIDKFTTQYKPDVVIIEALWVVPEKFEILRKLHPNVKWVIRLHSHIPFLANEGIAIEWLKGYVKQENVYIASNYRELIDDLSPILGSNILYLPNYYPVTNDIWNRKYREYFSTKKDYIHIACMGAVRPMKNQLLQAIAAINYANNNNIKLYFHMNKGRVEDGENALKNIIALFDNSSHELVLHDWLPHEDFLKLISTMDLGMQISLSETYNIVTADFINQDIPVITSQEIVIAAPECRVSSSDGRSIEEKISYILKRKNRLTKKSKQILKNNSEQSKKIWINFVHNFK